MSHLLPRMAALLFLAFALFLIAAPLTRALFVDKLDSNRAVAFTCSFRELPFESREIVLNISGVKVTLLNITAQTETYYLYSWDYASADINSIATLEYSGQTLLTVLKFKPGESTRYVVDGQITGFFRYGTAELVPVLIVENYHEFGFWDEFVSTNRFWLSQLAIMLWAAIAGCILASIGGILWVALELSEQKAPMEPASALTPGDIAQHPRD